MPIHPDRRAAALTLHASPAVAAAKGAEPVCTGPQEPEGTGSRSAKTYTAWEKVLTSRRIGEYFIFLIDD